MSNECELTIGAGTGQAAMGMYKVAIVDGKTKKVKWEQKEWRHNLILNSGMLMIATRTWADCFRTCYAGIGSAQQTYDSGTDTASSDGGGNLISVGATIDFQTFTTGDCILFDDGTQAYITAPPGSANAATITPDAGISSQKFTVLKTTLTGLSGNVKRHSAYLPNSPHCVTTRNGNVVAMRRTFDFADETGGVTVTEIGLSENTTYGSASVWGAGSPTLFSRIVLPFPVALTSGDSLRVIYQLQVTILPWPATHAVSTPVISNWPVLPATLQGEGGLVQLGLSGVAASGITAPALDSFANEPAAIAGASYTGMPWPAGTPIHGMWVDKTRKGFAWTWPANGIARTAYLRALKSPGSLVNTSYAGLTYSHDKQSIWGVAEANIDTWGGIAAVGFGYWSSIMGGESDPTVNCGYYFEFDENQTKTNIQKLTLRITYSWSRTLTVD